MPPFPPASEPIDALAQKKITAVQKDNDDEVTQDKRVQKRGIFTNRYSSRDCMFVLD